MPKTVQDVFRSAGEMQPGSKLVIYLPNRFYKDAKEEEKEKKKRRKKKDLNAHALIYV